MAFDLRDLGLEKSTYGSGFSDAYAVSSAYHEYEKGLADASKNKNTLNNYIEDLRYQTTKEKRGLLGTALGANNQNAEQPEARAKVRKPRQGLNRHQVQRHVAGRR